VQAEKPAQAVPFFLKALELEPKNLILRLSLIEALLGAGRTTEAAAAADQALELDPKNRLIRGLKGQALRDLRDWDGARQVVDGLLAENPDDLAAQYLALTIHESRQDFGAAEQMLRTMLRRSRQGEDEAQASRNDRRFLIHLGLALDRLGRHPEAAAAFAQAKTVGGEPDAELLLFEIEALLKAKDLDGAWQGLRAARERQPADRELRAMEATLLHERQEKAAALRAIAALRADAPEDVANLLRVAQFYQRTKDYTNAEEALREAQRVDPKDVRAAFALGNVLERARRYDEAEKALRAALTLAPESAPILNYLGYMNANRGAHLDEALQLIEKAVAIDPESGAYLDSLGWALYRLGRLEEAERHLRRAVEKLGTNAVVLDHLGDILYHTGRVAEAIECWRRALKGEDEEEELDQTQVTAKLRAANQQLGDRQP